MQKQIISPVPVIQHYAKAVSCQIYEYILSTMSAKNKKDKQKLRLLSQSILDKYAVMVYFCELEEELDSNYLNKQQISTLQMIQRLLSEKPLSYAEKVKLISFKI